MASYQDIMLQQLQNRIARQEKVKTDREAARTKNRKGIQNAISLALTVATMGGSSLLSLGMKGLSKFDKLKMKDLHKLYKRFCPGPITFILNLKKNSKISKIVTNKKDALAVRFPKHPVARSLLKKLDFPLAAPSANLSSKVSAVSSDNVKEDFGKKIKYVLEGGKSSIGLESTIIDIRNRPRILRLGGLETSVIKKVLKEKILMNTNPKKISSPGQLKIHYSPGIPIRLNGKYSYRILKK